MLLSPIRCPPFTYLHITPAPGESFDLVCGLEVVEHTTDPDLFVANCAALVRPGGALVMSTINRNPKVSVGELHESLQHLPPRGRTS